MIVPVLARNLLHYKPYLDIILLSHYNAQHQLMMALKLTFKLKWQPLILVIPEVQTIHIILVSLNTLGHFQGETLIPKYKVPKGHNNFSNYHGSRPPILVLI